MTEMKTGYLYYYNHRKQLLIRITMETKVY